MSNRKALSYCNFHQFRAFFPVRSLWQKNSSCRLCNQQLPKNWRQKQIRLPDKSLNEIENWQKNSPVVSEQCHWRADLSAVRDWMTTHEKELPTTGWDHNFSSDCVICLEKPDISIRVQESRWLESSYCGFAITNNEMLMRICCAAQHCLLFTIHAMRLF
jgi:hypothetical protein